MQLGFRTSFAQPIALGAMAKGNHREATVPLRGLQPPVVGA